MSIMQWNPMREIDSLRHQMDRLFDDFIRSDRDWEPSLALGSSAAWQPSIEIKDRQNDLIIRAQIPGVSAEDLDVQVSQNSVSIAGEHREEMETEAGDTFRSEFRYGKFQRVIPLPATVRHDAVTSDFTDGVLTLTLPKDSSVTPQTVKVNVTPH